MPRDKYNEVFWDGQSYKKKCCSCNVTKDVSEFARRRGGYHYTCKECKNAWSREYHAKRRSLGTDHPVYQEYSRKGRDRTFKRRYGITVDEYEALQEKQNHLCAICGCRETQKCPSGNGEIAPLALDHDHDTGKKRELLCRQCNQGIGNFRESPDLLRKAIEYLERHGKR